jgi:hypothetical protein
MRKSLILLLFIVLACGGVPAQDEPASKPNSWSSDMWNTYKIPIILIGVLAGITLVLVLVRRAENAHAEKVESYAKRNGWTYSRWDDKGVSRLLDTVFPEQSFFVYNLREVHATAPRVLLFDSKHRDPANAKNKVTSTGCLVELSRNESGPPMTAIVPMSVFDSILGSDVVDLKDEAFAKEFTVTSSDPLRAGWAVSPQVRSLLLEDVKRDSSEPISLIINSGHVLLLSGTIHLVEDMVRLNTLVELTKAIASAVESHSH